MARWTENYEWAVETGTMMQPRPVPGDYKNAANYAARAQAVTKRLRHGGGVT